VCAGSGSAVTEMETDDKAKVFSHLFIYSPLKANSSSNLVML